MFIVCTLYSVHIYQHLQFLYSSIEDYYFRFTENCIQVDDKQQVEDFPCRNWNMKT